MEEEAGQPHHGPARTSGPAWLRAAGIGHETWPRNGRPAGQHLRSADLYNYFKLESPGKYIISVCTGTACHIKGSPKLLHGVEAELGIKEGESTPDGEYHLQGVRCLGCCGLAPLASVNGKVYGKRDVTNAHGLLEQVKHDQPMHVAAESADAE